MKYFKILFLAIVISNFFFPTNILAYFATPDEYVHSMPFGVQLKSAPAPEIPAPSVLNRDIDEDVVNIPLQESHNSNEDNKNNKTITNPLPGLSKDLSWITFLSAVLIVVGVFVLLKNRKVI
jgi:hypothetical protein